jgi:hypothetical protein
VTNATVVVLSIEASFEVVSFVLPAALLPENAPWGGRVPDTPIYAGRETAGPPRLLRLA